MSNPLSLRDMRAWRRATTQYREPSTEPEPIDVLLDIAEAAQEYLRILDEPMSGHRAVGASRSKLREALAKAPK